MPDWLGQATVSAAGTATVTIQHQLANVIWEVEQITAQTGTVAAATTAFIKKNGVVVAPSASLTPVDVGQAATAGGLPYIYIRNADAVTVQVQGASTGDTLTVRAQYREFQDTDSNIVGR